MKKAKDLNQLIDLVHEAVYEVDELRACLDHDDDEASAYTPYLDSLDSMLRELHESMVSGKYGGVGQGEDLAFRLRYLMRCGISASLPNRRLRSSS